MVPELLQNAVLFTTTRTGVLALPRQGGGRV